MRWDRIPERERRGAYVLDGEQGEAKPYQIRQFLRLVERYNLQMEEER